MPRKEDNISAALRAIGGLESLVRRSVPQTLAKLAAVLHLPRPTLYRVLAMLARANPVRDATRRGRASPRSDATGRSRPNYESHSSG